MRLLISVIGFALACGLTGAVAQNSPDEGDANRYLLEKTAKGYLRLDRRTGAISFCKPREDGWSCNMAADDRKALEAELDRVQAENARLREQLAALGDGPPEVETFTPPDGAPETPDASIPKGENELPSDEEVDRVMNFAEKMMRRFFDMVDRLQKDYGGDRIGEQI